MKSIGNILADGLCCNCGTCAGVCPSKAVSLVINCEKGLFEPRIDEAICINCGKCYDLCPGYHVNFQDLNCHIFGQIPEDIQLGNYRSCHIGHANDHNIRYNASSGGAVTALLVYALSNGIINGALVTKMNDSDPFKSEPFIARTCDELLEASGSKYCPVSTNILLREISDSNDDMRFAVVGLPCQIQGLRAAELKNNDLKKKIVIHIGLFCSHTDTFNQTKLLVDSMKISPEDITKIYYRGDGWPGRFSANLRNGNSMAMPFHKAMSFHKFWINALPRCFLCFDLTAEFADISCGDPWLPDIISNETTGKSLIISRTKTGEEIFCDAAEKGYISREIIDPIRIKESTNMTRTKKKDIMARLFIWRLLNKPTPEYKADFERAAAMSFLRSIVIYFNLFIMSNTLLRKFLKLFI